MNENEPSGTENFLRTVGISQAMLVLLLTILALIYVPIFRYILTLITLIILIGILIEAADASRLDEEE